MSFVKVVYSLGREKISDEELIELHSKGLTDEKIADIKDMNCHTIGVRRRELGLEAVKRHKIPYSINEIEKIKSRLNEDVSVNEIAKELNRSYHYLLEVVNKLEDDSGWEFLGRREKHYEVRDYLSENSPVLSSELVDEIDIPVQKIAKYVRESGFERLKIPKRTVSGLGSPRVFGDIGGETLIYQDEEKARDFLLEHIEDLEIAKKITDFNYT